MKVKDVMTSPVLSVESESPISQAIQLMLEKRISGLPVLDGQGRLVGIVTEGDFLRRTETGTQRRRSRWLEFLIGPGRLADEYTRSHGRKVIDVMTPDPVTINEQTSLEQVVQIMEKHRIKRLPVLREQKLVGIVSRANLLHALASLSVAAPSPKTDEAIREAVLAELDRQSWAPRHMIDVVVRNGVVELWGAVIDSEQRKAARVVAETVPGVKAVKSHIVWVEPISGMAFSDPEEDEAPIAPAMPPAPPIRAAVG